MKYLIILFFSVAQLWAVNFDLISKQVLTDHSLIYPERAGRAVIAATDTAAPRTGHAVLRQLNPNLTYSLYHGRLKEEAWSQLSVFANSDLDLWQAFLHGKFYTHSPNSESSAEIAQVLWDQGVILTPQLGDSLFIKLPQGTAVLIASHQRPVELEITSRTLETMVWIENIPVGYAPQKVRWLLGPSVRIRLEAPGHQPWEDLVLANHRTPTLVEQSLTPLPTGYETLPIDNSFLSAHGSKDQAQFSVAMQNLIDAGLNLESEHKLAAISEWIDTLNQRLYVEYIAPYKLSISPWDSTLKGIPVRIWYGQNGFDFGFEGKIPCTQEESFTYEKVFASREAVTVLKHSQRPRRSSWPAAQPAVHSDALVRLNYFNFKTPVRANNRLVERYYAMESLQLLLPDRIIDIPGTFFPAGYIKNTTQWQKFNASGE